jgi:hypothetical protein
MSRKLPQRTIGLSIMKMEGVFVRGSDEVNKLLRIVFGKSRRPKLREGISVKIRTL